MILFVPVNVIVKKWALIMEGGERNKALSDGGKGKEIKHNIILLYALFPPGIGLHCTQ